MTKVQRKYLAKARTQYNKLSNAVGQMGLDLVMAGVHQELNPLTKSIMGLVGELGRKLNELERE